MNRALQAAENFRSRDESITGVEKYGHGIIHDTYLVRLNRGAKKIILQRLNSEVFKDPEAVMYNLHHICEHIQEQMKINSTGVAADWQMLQNIATRDGRDFFIDAAGDFWRALSFIRGAVPLEHITGPDDAGEAGRALGIFHWLLSDLSPELLLETLPGFHNVEGYLKHYDEVVAKRNGPGAAEKYCQQFIEDRRSWAPVLENGRREKIITVRIIHGDPKVNNIMADRVTGRAVSIIDLDTVMPGLVQYDIGDCLRSCCSTMGEEAADLSAVRFDLDLCEAVLSGYTGAARKFLSNTDFDFLFDAVRLLPFELGLRFYTDFLEGNVYFRVNHLDQNLDRAQVQFKLVESIEQQEDMIRAIIEKCRVVCLANTHQ